MKKTIKQLTQESKKLLNRLTLTAIIGGVALFILGVIIGLLIASM